MDPRQELIFEAWFDYEHATDEEAKAAHKQRRSSLIVSAMREAKVNGTVGDFLHSYRDRYRDWTVAKLLKLPRRRF